MRFLAFFIAVLGFLIVLGAVMMAFDSYITDERRAAVQDGITARLDENAADFEQSRADGCRRRCGFFDTLSHAIVGARDGVFLSLPFEPRAVLPPAPAGWTATAFDLATVEQIIGRTFQRTAIITPTDNRLLGYLDDAAALRTAGAVQIYSKDETYVVVSVVISQDGLRDAKKSRHRLSNPVETPFVTLSGLPVLEHPQVSVDPLRDTETPVDYRHFTMDIDAQVDIKLIAQASDEDVQTILAALDMARIAGDLPAVPAAFDATAGLMIPAPVATDEDQPDQ